MKAVVPAFCAVVTWECMEIVRSSLAGVFGIIYESRHKPIRGLMREIR